MTVEAARVVELLQRILEKRPELRVGQLLVSAALQSGATPFYVTDRDLLHGLIELGRLEAGTKEAP